jgi:hypothetical protein
MQAGMSSPLSLTLCSHNSTVHSTLSNISGGWEFASYMCHVEGGTRDEMMGSSSDNWIY